MPGGRPRLLLDDEDTQRVLKEWEQGTGYSAIAVKLGLSVKRVRNTIEAAGHTIEKRMKAEQHGRWKGGQPYYHSGYKYVWISQEHPFRIMANTNGRVAEHRLVMAEHLGRPLEYHESVHHKNGVRDDNRLENLQLLVKAHPTGYIPRCRCCGSYEIIFEEL
jgi:hypothetical protein